MTFEEARREADVYIVGCDPGPLASAFVMLRMEPGNAAFRTGIVKAAYVSNDVMGRPDFAEMFITAVPSPAAMFLAYEKLGNQGKTPGDATFETAAAGGEIRRAFRPYVEATYALRSSEWRHPLTGIGGAKTPLVYQEICRFFRPEGGGSDPYKGIAKKPGPLWDFHKAGAGGKVEHLKDAMGVALGLSQVRFRSGRDPEIYRLPY